MPGVMLARAIAQGAGTVVLDEPNAHLDIADQQSVLRMLRQRMRERSMCIVASIHDLNLASIFCDSLMAICHAVWRAEVAIGAMASMSPGATRAHSRTCIPPRDPPMTRRIRLTARCRSNPRGKATMSRMGSCGTGAGRAGGAWRGGECVCTARWGAGCAGAWAVSTRHAHGPGRQIVVTAPPPTVPTPRYEWTCVAI